MLSLVESGPLVYHGGRGARKTILGLMLLTGHWMWYTAPCVSRNEKIVA